MKSGSGEGGCQTAPPPPPPTNGSPPISGPFDEFDFFLPEENVSDVGGRGSAGAGQGPNKPRPPGGSLSNGLRDDANGCEKAKRTVRARTRRV